MLRANIHDAEMEFDPSDPEGYRAGMNNVGKAAGGTENNVKLFEIPSGESLCPYHYEYVEEWLLVLDGEVVVRTTEGDDTARSGDLIRFPAGPDGAHKLTNRSERAARAIMFSSSAEPSVAVYPDSDKIGIWAGTDKLMVRRADGNVDYYVGETG